MRRIGCRWRTKSEVKLRKGDRICGNVICDEDKGLSVYEINFKYREQEKDKNAMVKVTVCRDCEMMLNFRVRIPG